MHVKKRLQSEKKKLPTKMFSSIYIQNRSQKCTTKYLYCFVWFLLYHMLHLSYPDFTALTSLWPYNLFFFFFLNIWIFKNLPQTRVSHNVNISNLGNVLQRNLRKNRAAKEYILEHLETQIFKILHQLCYTNHKWHL